MNENELLIGKRSVLKTTFIVFAGALALGLFTGKDGFNEILFAIAFLVLGIANVGTINTQVIISLRERFPEWSDKCFDVNDAMKMYLSSSQKAALKEYMENDEQAEQLKQEYAFSKKISVVLLVVSILIPVAALLLS